MRVLAIESSCDETSVCYYDGVEYHTATMSSLPKLAKLGGVIPEIAAREHEIAFPYCLEQLPKDMRPEVIAYTKEPGLPGSLYVGTVVAQTLAHIYGVPLVPVNHIHGHVFSSFIDSKPELPMLSLVVSGGHSAIYLVDEGLKVKKLLSSPDDAMGEVMDKVGRRLGYAYPAGPLIDKAYDPKKADLRFIRGTPFSFSGLKTAASQWIEKKGVLTQEDVVRVGSSLNRECVEIVLTHLKGLARKHRPKSLSLGGGVAANRLLRSEVAKLGYPVHVPAVRYCTDNAAMIAAAVVAQATAKPLKRAAERSV